MSKSKSTPARRRARRTLTAPGPITALGGTVGSLFAYVASMRPLRGVADLECRDEYQRGRSLIQRLGISATGDEDPTLALSHQDCADILYFMHCSEPVQATGWWRDPGEGPSHVMGQYRILQAIEKALLRGAA